MLEAVGCAANRHRQARPDMRSCVVVDTAHAYAGRTDPPAGTAAGRRHGAREFANSAALPPSADECWGGDGGGGVR
eukprot:1219241-Prymnesium_polylepis.1